MMRQERAKQFMPFDAMKGLQEALRDRAERHTRVERHDISDEALAENRHSLDETMRQAEKDVNKPVVLEQSEAEMSYEDILNEFGPKKK